jgi:Uma2 family endonuclease
MTIQEYFNTPETVLPQELIYGHVIARDAPFVSHQRVVLKLALALQRHAGSRALGEVLIAPTDVVLDRDRGLVVQPDLLFVGRERSSIVLDRVYGAPDLVIEVLSPDPRIGQLKERVAWFAEYGVREVWLYHQHLHRLDVLACADGRVTRAVPFEAASPIESAVLPLFGETMRSVLSAP